MTVSLLESNATEQSRLYLFIAVTAVALLITCVLLAILLGRWLTAPLTKLAQLVHQRRPDDEAALAQQFAHDEIGALATVF